MNINKDTTKKTLNVCAKIGAGTIASTVARNSVATDNPVLKVMVVVGAFALASAAARVAGNEMDAIVEDVASFVNQSDAKIYIL